MDNTRVAPSPTGDMHIGTVRTAYFNWLAAKSTGGKFILRIDDTDDARNKQACVTVIYETMRWLGLNYDLAFKQSDRWRQYRDAAETLISAGLTTELDNGAIALRWFDRYGKTWTDSIAGEIPISDTNKAQIDGRLILLKGRPQEGQPNCFGKPTYQFASVVDDYQFGINHIIRGTDHIPNTPKQIAIWCAMNDVMKRIGQRGVELPRFTHVGLIMKDKKKLSKRDNAASMLAYKEKGYVPAALLSFMLRLGWGGGEIPDTPITMRSAIELFTKGTMKNINVGFDQGKLDFFQRYYQKELAA